MELFECERLQARISPATCETNRKRTGHYQIFACQGCPGLGQKIDDNEVSAMAQRCSIHKCEKLAQHGCEGMCKSHYRKHLQAVLDDEAAQCAICGNSGLILASSEFCDCQYGVELERAGSTTPSHLNTSSAPDGVAAVVDMSGAVTVVADRSKSFGQVVNAEGTGVSFGVDGLVLQAIREAWAETEARLLPQLSGLKPSAALVRAAKVVEQLEGIGC